MPRSPGGPPVREGGGEDEIVVLGVAPGVDGFAAGIFHLAAKRAQFAEQGGGGGEFPRDLQLFLLEADFEAGEQFVPRDSPMDGMAGDLAAGSQRDRNEGAFQAGGAEHVEDRLTDACGIDD